MHKDSPKDPQLPKSLHEVLRAMEPKDRKLFGQYLQFEPFNSQQKLADLYELIIVHFFSTKEPNTDWNDALQKSGINPSQIPKLLTFLHQKLDQFLAFQQIQNAPHRHLSYSLEAYNALKVDHATTEKKWRQLSKKLQTDPMSTEHLHELIDLEHFAIKSRITAQAQVEGSYFADLHRLIDQHYLLCKLKYACAAINEAQLLKLPFPATEADQVQAFFATYPHPVPAFGLAYAAILALQIDPALPLPQYAGVLDQLVQYQPEISPEDNFDLFNYLLNLCFRRIDVGDPGFEALVVKLYNQLIASELLNLNGEIQPRVYKNIVSFNCRQGHFEWCRKFIQDHQSLLPLEDQAILPKYCRGLVAFYEGDHASSSRIFAEIIQINPEDHFWSFESRNLLLKSYFHRYTSLTDAEHDHLYKLVDAFRMYVRRNSKLDTYHQQSYLNFIRYFTLLLRHLDQQEAQPFPDTLKKAIEEEKLITNKGWLLKVLEKNS